MAKIKNLPKHSRPREKLLKHGVEKLTDAELLAILLRTGTKGKSAIDIAEDLLRNVGDSFRDLAGKDIEKITKIPGIKEAKVVTLPLEAPTSVGEASLSTQVLQNIYKIKVKIPSFKINFPSIFTVGCKITPSL